MTSSKYYPDTKFTVMGTIFLSFILSDREFLLTDLRSAKILDKVVEEVQKCSIFVP